MTFKNPNQEKSAQKGRKKGGGDNRKKVSGTVEKRIQDRIDAPPILDIEKILKDTFGDDE